METIIQSEKFRCLLDKLGSIVNNFYFQVKNVISLYSIVNSEEPVVCSADHHFIDSEGKTHLNI